VDSGQLARPGSLRLHAAVEEAKAHYLDASRLEPKRTQLHNDLGKIFMREAKVAQAIVQFEEALRLHPDFPEAKENLRMAKASDAQSLSQSPK
jgi:Flp pilus assembly protein TadD